MGRWPDDPEWVFTNASPTPAGVGWRTRDSDRTAEESRKTCSCTAWDVAMLIHFRCCQSKSRVFVVLTASSSHVYACVAYCMHGRFCVLCPNRPVYSGLARWPHGSRSRSLRLVRWRIHLHGKSIVTLMKFKESNIRIKTKKLGWSNAGEAGSLKHRKKSKGKPKTPSKDGGKTG